MSQEKILGNQLNIPDVAADVAADPSAIAALEGSIDHANINSVGTTSHADIDAHIAQGSPAIHNTFTDIVQDTTPQLGANLDTNGFNIIGVDGDPAGGINIIAGDTAASAGYAGDVNISAGEAPNTFGYAGHININAGNAGSVGIAGNIVLTSGNGDGGSGGGNIDLTSGNSIDGGPGGAINITGGEALAGSLGGDINLSAGSSNLGGAGADGGVINIIAGDSGTTGDGGDVRITPGNGTTTVGNVAIHYSNGVVGQASVQFWDDTNTGHTTGNYVALKAPSFAGSTNITFALPELDGSNGDAMLTDGAGNLSIGTPRNVLNDWASLSGSPPGAVLAGDRILAETDIDIVGIELPTGVVGDIVEVVDSGNNATTNNITITPATGEKMEAVVDAAFVISANLGTVNFVYTGTTSGWIAR